MILYDNFQINSKGHLEIGGCDSVELAKEYATPLYVLDENQIRKNCRAYKNAIKKYLGENGGDVAFASKALSFKGIYKIIAEENLYTDIVSPGELATVKAAGFPLEKTFYHGNNKTDFDIEYGLQNNIGIFVVDNFEEIEKLDKLCDKYNKTQKILLRITPGIDAHTHVKVQTAKIDSKFGISIGTGQAIEAVDLILKKKNLDFIGIHCHIGSQILDIQPFKDTVECMIDFTAEIKNKYNYEISVVNLGGGFGVKYLPEQEELNIDCGIKTLSEYIIKKCRELNIKVPKIFFEPGRSIVANAGATLYTVGTNKKITGYKNYISVDGSMSDNPRYALYESPYTIVAANKMNEECKIIATIAGRCCESGDLIQEKVKLPDLNRGDILAVLITGAYNYSMAMNYNRLPKPAIIWVNNGESKIAVKRETFEDLMKNEI
ncbi:MAG: diaminopimelate decarboxylase [Oscillospiraceae bacterium]|nr:diaminopimelate decarboxylase [Oscillospiraceae bacterium]